MLTGKLKYLCLAAPIALAACGEGWQMDHVKHYVPYAPERTAGSGVAYVLARMAPAKEIQTEEPVFHAPEEPQEKAGPPAEIKSFEPVFQERQVKGAVSEPKAELEPQAGPAEPEHPDAPSEAGHAEHSAPAEQPERPEEKPDDAPMGDAEPAFKKTLMK